MDTKPLADARLGFSHPALSEPRPSGSRSPNLYCSTFFSGFDGVRDFSLRHILLGLIGFSSPDAFARLACPCSVWTVSRAARIPRLAGDPPPFAFRWIGEPKSLVASPREVVAVRSNFALARKRQRHVAGARRSRPFATEAPSRAAESISPRSTEISSELVKSLICTSRERVERWIGPTRFDAVKSPSAMRTWPGSFSMFSSSARP